jgi:hypothetical protein
MDNKRFFKVIIIYIILIPVTWILSAAVTGGVYGFIGGKRIAKAYSDTQLGNEMSDFMKKHGFSESMTKEESQQQFEKLSPQDKAEFKRILFKRVATDDILDFGSIFAICVIVFSFIGLLSGLFTRIWIPAGIFPIVALLIDPIRHFIVYGYMSSSQRVITTVFGQFAICYAFAYLGALLAKRFSKNKGTNLPVHSDAPKGGA